MEGENGEEEGWTTVTAPAQRRQPQDSPKKKRCESRCFSGPSGHFLLLKIAVPSTYDMLAAQPTNEAPSQLYERVRASCCIGKSAVFKTGTAIRWKELSVEYPLLQEFEKSLRWSANFPDSGPPPWEEKTEVSQSSEATCHWNGLTQTYEFTAKAVIPSSIAESREDAIQAFRKIFLFENRAKSQIRCDQTIINHHNMGTSVCLLLGKKEDLMQLREEVKSNLLSSSPSQSVGDRANSFLCVPLELFWNEEEFEEEISSLAVDQLDAMVLSIHHHILAAREAFVRANHQPLEADHVLLTAIVLCKLAFLSLPGGKRELTETPLECAIRECKEEAVIDVSTPSWTVDYHSQAIGKKWKGNACRDNQYWFVYKPRGKEVVGNDSEQH